jgi:Xaa-Pro aminopeptidase
MISQSEYRARRKKLMDSFADDGACIYLYGGPPVEEGVRFIPNAYFRYLTGITLPDVSMLLLPGDGEYVLFAPEPTLHEAVWTGKKPTHGELKERFGADAVYGRDKILEFVRKNKGALHSIPGASRPFARFSHARLRSELLEARLRKSPAEIREIEKSVTAASEAVTEAMKATPSASREGEIAALIKYVYERKGGRASFPPIATMEGAVLHETWTDRPLKKNRLLLVDTGAAFEYGCDISRTWPVGGRFTAVQKAIYEIVLRAKNEAIGAIREGVKFRDVHFVAVKVIIDGLVQEKILKGNPEDILSSGAYRLFFPHGLGHTFGLPGDGRHIHGNGTSLARGMPEGYVTTVEPGIYFNATLEAPVAYGKHREFVNLGKARKLMKSVSGIRIEDDVLVAKKGSRILGPPIPETVDEIVDLVGMPPGMK